MTDLDKVHILHRLPLIEIFPPELGSYLRFPVDCASFDVKNHFWMVLVHKLAGILHDHDVQRVEIVALNRKNSINSCQEGLVVGILDVPDVVIQHA